jgi:hypothetical protein
MTLPFTTEQFLAVFEQYNQAVISYHANEMNSWCPSASSRGLPDTSLRLTRRGFHIEDHFTGSWFSSRLPVCTGMRAAQGGGMTWHL